MARNRGSNFVFFTSGQPAVLSPLTELPALSPPLKMTPPSYIQFPHVGLREPGKRMNAEQPKGTAGKQAEAVWPKGRLTHNLRPPA